MSDQKAADDYGEANGPTAPDMTGGNANLRRALARAFLAGVKHERERAARIAWDMQSTQFGGGTAIGNAIQEPPK